MEELFDILNEVCPHVDFANETALIDNEILDSLDIVMLVGEISAAYGIQIGPEDLTPDNFNSAEAIYKLICSLQDE